MTPANRPCGSRALKDLGIRLAIDDFGTGYSSLAYLQQFPVDILKIDRTFLVGSPTTGPSTALVHALIELGNALGLKTVAEGIETVEQLMRLKLEGCDAGQGFYFSHPLEEADAEQFLAAARDGGAPAHRPQQLVDVRLCGRRPRTAWSNRRRSVTRNAAHTPLSPVGRPVRSSPPP